MLSSQLRTKTLNGFCDLLLDEFKTPQLVWPETIAEKFSKYFSLFPAIGKKELLYLCEKIGLQEPLGIPLPRGVRGMNIGSNNNFVILYEEGDWEGGVRHTILHEIWEIIIHILDGYVTCNLPQKNKEARANIFAASVLMPRKQFLEDSVMLSFDPLRLREKYKQSYQSITIRMENVIGRETTFTGLLYENFVLYEYLKLKKNPLKSKDLYELNNGYNFMVTCIASYNLKGTPYVLAELPRCGEPVKDGNFFHDIAIQTAEEEDILRYFRMPVMSGLLLGCYPVISKFKTIEKIIIIGIDENGWESLRTKIRTYSVKP